jgi:transcriptional regulator with XRE-family HTH domain
MRKNYAIIKAISEKRLTQAQLARMADISSEARLSRIIHYLAEPKMEEINRLSNILGLSEEEIRGVKDGI